MSERTMLLSGLAPVARDAAVALLASAGLAVAVNGWFHPEGIPLIAKQPYQTLVPCPAVDGKVSPMSASDPRLGQPTTFVIDARDEQEHRAWHLPRSLRVTYDYLEPLGEDALTRLAKRIAASRARQVAVYGDGDDPDSGEQLAKEIASRGIKNVHFVRGGAPALRDGKKPR